jgi:hypothetical protein
MRKGGGNIMRTFLLPLAAALGIAGLAAVTLAPSGSVAQHHDQDGPRAADMEPAPFNPQLGAMMGMLIQPRHAKLGLAGKAENWQLAGYMLRELRQGLVIAGRAVPRWKGLPIPDLFEAAMDPVMPVLDFAIKAGEPRQFAESYAKLTQGCNNCHATTDHPFIVVKVPDESAWPNQDFRPVAR